MGSRKSGSAQMWWIIIGAVIALVVMIVLMILFTDKSQDIQLGLMDCEGKGGKCVSKDDCDPDFEENVRIVRGFDCSGVNSNYVCCFGAD